MEATGRTTQVCTVARGVGSNDPLVIASKSAISGAKTALLTDRIPKSKFKEVVVAEINKIIPLDQDNKTKLEKALEITLIGLPKVDFALPVSIAKEGSDLSGIVMHTLTYKIVGDVDYSSISVRVDVWDSLGKEEPLFFSVDTRNHSNDRVFQQTSSF